MLPVRTHSVLTRRSSGLIDGEEMQVAVSGCIVSGPGESKHANIGISLPGTGEQPTAPVFIDGKKEMTLRGPDLAREFKAIVDKYVETKYPDRKSTRLNSSH